MTPPLGPSAICRVAEPKAVRKAGAPPRVGEARRWCSSFPREVVSPPAPSRPHCPPCTGSPLTPWSLLLLTFLSSLFSLKPTKQGDGILNYRIQKEEKNGKL